VSSLEFDFLCSLVSGLILHMLLVVLRVSICFCPNCEIGSCSADVPSVGAVESNSNSWNSNLGNGSWVKISLLFGVPKLATSRVGIDRLLFELIYSGDRTFWC